MPFHDLERKWNTEPRVRIPSTIVPKVIKKLSTEKKWALGVFAVITLCLVVGAISALMGAWLILQICVGLFFTCVVGGLISMIVYTIIFEDL